MKVATAVEVSRNHKLGLCHATYVTQASCPPDCKFLGEGCYAENGHVGIITRRLNAAAVGASLIDIAQAEAIAIEEDLSGRLDLRLRVVGDSPSNEAAALVSEAAAKKVARHRNSVWAYTHNWRKLDQKSFGTTSVLASCETLEGVEQARDAGWNAAVVVDHFPHSGTFDLGNGQKAFACPNQTHGISCVECRLCTRPDLLKRRNISIAFEAHGSRGKHIGRLGNLVQMGSV